MQVRLRGFGAFLGLLLATATLSASSARACGGFFCNGGGTGPTPVVQAAERIIFEQHDDGTIRAYVQIRYDQGGPPVGFSWIIPVLAIPEVGIAEASTFDELDQATSPQFRFVNNTLPVRSGTGGGACSADSARAGVARDTGSSMDVDGETVWGASRVGNYETATISSDRAEDLLNWLERNGYDIPADASGLIDQYVSEGHLFVAFKFAPLDPGTGALDPVVLTYRAEKPCVPLRITAIASTPVLDVMILAFGPRRAIPEGAYVLTEPAYDAVRPDFSSPSQTTYPIEVFRAIEAAGGRAFVTELASTTESLGAMTDLEAQALTARNAYVTRLYTRMTPEAMTVDPELSYDGGDDVGRLHVIDITAPSAATAVITDSFRYAAAPGMLIGAAVLLFVRRRRRRRAGASQV